MSNAPQEFYHHPPGAPSRWGVLDVGLKCTSSCKFCYYSHLNGEDDQFEGMRKAKFHETEWLKNVVRGLKQNGFVGFDVTGGEPTIHKGLPEIIQEATDIGLATRIITLGQFLTRKDLLQRLLDAGVTDFLFSYHAPTEELFHKITGESLGRLEEAMSALDEKGFQYSTNTTVIEDNYKFLPEIACNIIKHKSYVHNFIVMNAYYGWSDGSGAGVQAKYKELYPYLLEARDILEDAGIAVNIRYAPLCSVQGMERNLVGITGVRYDPHEWMNTIDHKAPPDGSVDPASMAQRIEIRPGSTPGALLLPMNAKHGDMQIIAGRGASTSQPSKLFPASCGSCTAVKVCDGIDANYLARNGSDEFKPYLGQSRGSFLDIERLKYRAAFAVKLMPWADMKAEIQKILTAQ